MQKTAEEGVSVWFWSRHDHKVPDEIRTFKDSVSPDSSWGEPSARFLTTSCDYASHFNAHSIVFDVTFCVRIRLQAHY